MSDAPGIDRVQQDFLEIADDRRVVDFCAGALIFLRQRFIVGEFEVDVFASQILQRSVGGLGNFFDQLAELVVLHHHRFDREAGLEPHIIQGAQVGRVGGGDEQAVAALLQGQNAPALISLASSTSLGR